MTHDDIIQAIENVDKSDPRSKQTLKDVLRTSNELSDLLKKRKKSLERAKKLQSDSNEVLSSINKLVDSKKNNAQQFEIIFTFNDKTFSFTEKTSTEELKSSIDHFKSDFTTCVSDLDKLTKQVDGKNRRLETLVKKLQPKKGRSK